MLRLAIVAIPVLLTAACAGSTTSPSSSTLFGANVFHADVTDPIGDAVASAGVLNPPDLIRSTVDVTGANATFTIQFTPGTLDRQSTRLTIELDTDQNPSTGIRGANGVGIDYVLDMWAGTSQTTAQRAMPGACATGGLCYMDVGTAPLNIGTDQMSATVPLTLLGNASGRLNYRVFSYASPQPTTPTVTADVMPDLNLPPAHVP